MFALDYQPAGSKAEALRARQRSHDHKKSLVEYSLRLGVSSRGCLRHGIERKGVGVDFVEVYFLGGKRTYQQECEDQQLSNGQPELLKVSFTMAGGGRRPS